MKKKIISVFGTRPEAIKMAPLVKELEKNENFESIVAVTAQHREMLDQVLNLFDIKPKYDLNIMKQNQTLYDVTCNALKGLEEVLTTEKPDMILVHGDTTTTFAASLAAYYQQIPVGHVEAGLRSNDIYSPFPEEINRKLTGSIASIHFAPTNKSRDNLLRENVDEKNIFITGNTVIDALLDTVEKEYDFHDENLNNFYCKNSDKSDKMILVTAHRRENHGKPMEEIFKALVDIHDEFKNVKIIFPIHKNPKVREVAKRILTGKERIKVIEPMDYQPFSNLINNSDLVLTDSGGIQEEAPSLGKPVLVLRENTERPEALNAGTVKLVGTNRENIYNIVKNLLTQKSLYDKMTEAINPYGDGQASKRIVQALEYYFEITDKKPEAWTY